MVPVESCVRVWSILMEISLPGDHLAADQVGCENLLS